MKKKTPYIALLFVLAINFLHAQSADKAYDEMLKKMYANSVELIPSKALDSMLLLDDVYVLDTRTPAEYKTSHINGASFLNYDTFSIRKMKDIPKDATIVLYCSVGWRSERIGEKLLKNGYKNVFNLYGGMFEWYNLGYPVYNSEGETNDIHTYDSNWGKWVKKRK